MNEPDDDERWITIDGRRWRRTDPSIPETFRKELVDELMSARRAVAAAKRADDADRVARARHRVQSAKVALGERGAPWWDEPDEAALRARVEAAISALARHRHPDRTICPSDAARAVGGPGWRRHMDLVRTVAAGMAEKKLIDVVQRGEVVQGRDWRGPVRLRSRDEIDGC